MTDAEIICEWMEPKPPLPLRYSHLAISQKGWWVLGTVNGGGMRWYPGMCGDAGLTLDALHEVEERLTEEQWWQYEKMARSIPYDQFIDNEIRCALHATAEQKIKALAAVLKAGIRTPVEGEKP